MKRRIIAALVGFLVGMGLALSTNAAIVDGHQMGIGHLSLNQQDREYIQGREWLGEIFADLGSGIQIRFRPSHRTGDPLRSIDFILGTSTTADVKKACLDRIERIANHLRGQGRQVLSGTCNDVVGGASGEMKKVVGQVICCTTI